MTHRKTGYRHRAEALEQGEFVPVAPAKSRKWPKPGTQAHADLQALIERKREKKERAVAIIREEMPDLDTVTELVAYMPDSGNWTEPIRLAGLAFLVGCQERKGGDPDREGMEAWSIRHGLRPDYLYKLTRRQGFRKAFYNLVLAKDLMAGIPVADRVHAMAMASDDPRWAQQSIGLTKRAADQLGLTEPAGTPQGPSFSDADAVYRRTVTVTEERRGPRPDPTMALPEQEGTDGE